MKYVDNDLEKKDAIDIMLTAHVVDLTVSEARSLIDDAPEEISAAVDEAQGPVFGGDAEVGYVVLRIRR